MFYAERVLGFDYDHSEGGPHLIEASYVPGYRLLYLLHGVCFDPGHDVINPVDHVHILDILNLPEFL